MKRVVKTVGSACAIGSLVLSLQATLPAADCNANGRDDAEDIASGGSQDCNHNQVPDECDVAPIQFGLELEASLPAGVVAQALDAQDMDGDGKIALVMSSFSREISFLRQNGNGAFAPAAVFALGEGSFTLLTADLDGDGDDLSIWLPPSRLAMPGA